MEAYTQDSMRVLIWAVIVLGGSLISIVVYGVRMALARMDRQDDALEEIRLLLASELSKLRDMHNELDKRVVRIEAGYNHRYQQDEVE